jgi:4-diphosphocytidyl-2-C-methyl-D-erythritol kinase
VSLPLRALAPAKINLGLFAGPLRADRRHEIVTVMQSISLADELVLARAREARSEEPRGGRGDARGEQRPAGTGGAGDARGDEVICPGVDASVNLAALALARFRAAFHWDAPPLRLSIAKRVPIAGGLGGGSADAAAALRLASAAFARVVADSVLLDLAASLGADVPAQVRPGRFLARGSGELLEELAPPAPFGVLVLPLAASLRTPEVYAHADRLRPPRSSAELAQKAAALREALRDGASLPPFELLANDLEAAAISLCPAISHALALARETGCDHALLSGSGPTVLGLFDGASGPERAQAAAQRLAPRNPPAYAAVPVAAPFGDPLPG